MNEYVADTMALILRLESRQMPQKIKKIFQLAEKDEAKINIPAMVFAELAYLSEKGRIDTSLVKVKKYLQTHPNIKESPMNFQHIIQAFEIDDIPELHDRLIAAVGKQLDVPVLTNDPALHNSKKVNCIWE